MFMAFKPSLPHWRPRYRTSWQRQYQCIPRWVRLMVLAIVAVFGFVGLFHGIRDIHDSNFKEYSTNFGSLDDGHLAWIPQIPTRKVTNERHIDNQYHYLRMLGKGREGSAALYMDASSGDKVVIKAFANIARNPLPAHLAKSEFGNYTTTWPTEIEAGLLMAGTSVKSSYLGVIDYFILQEDDHWSWALVVPFVSAGTLVNLAKHERQGQSEHRSADQLDLEHRSKFNSLLTALAPLHAADLCHDDIKADNVMVASNEHWLVGDLGAVRHASHPWHSTATWQLQNQWPNCQHNDIRRTMKTYLWFLREASADTASFDRQFWERTTPWSSMYWTYIHSPVDIHQALDSSTREFAAKAAEHKGADPAGEQSTLRASEHELSRATEAELLCTTVPWNLWKHWWLRPSP